MLRFKGGALLAQSKDGPNELCGKVDGARRRVDPKVWVLGLDLGKGKFIR